MNFSKSAGRRKLTKGAGAVGDKKSDLIADKITSIGNKPKHVEQYQQLEEIIIQPEKRQQIRYDLRLF